MHAELERERDQCRLLVDAEKRDAMAAKDKLAAQLAQLKLANDQVLSQLASLAFNF